MHVSMKIIFTSQQKTPQDEPCGVFELRFQEYDYSQDQDLIDFKPEYLIVALGENVPELKMKEEQCAYRDAFLKLLKGFLSSNPAPENGFYYMKRHAFFSSVTVSR